MTTDDSQSLLDVFQNLTENDNVLEHREYIDTGDAISLTWKI